MTTSSPPAPEARHVAMFCGLWLAVLGLVVIVLAAVTQWGAGR